MRARSRRLRLAAAAVFLLAVFPGQAAHAAEQPPPDAVSALTATYPNYWRDHIHDGFARSGQWDDINASGIVDRVRHRVVFSDSYACPWLVSQDADTGATIATNRGADGSCPMTPTVMGHSKALPGALDVTDGLIIYLSQSDAGLALDPSAPSGYLVLASEDTLLPVLQVPLPAGPHNSVTALSWYAPADQVIVAGANFFDQQLPGGVSIYSYSVPALRAGGTQPEWSAFVPQCASLLSPYFASADVYRSGDGGSLYVPCELPGGGQTDGGGAPPQDGVVKLHLGARDPLGNACAPDPCPDGGFSVAEAPAAANDFLFDEGSDRGFLVAQNSQSVDLVVYDGRSGRFIGRSNVGGPEDINDVAFGLDDTTGRIYAAGGGGLTVIDGRSTPVSPGDLHREDAGKFEYVTLPILPPDAHHPYRRLLVPHEVAGSGAQLTDHPLGCYSCDGQDFHQLADTTAPPAAPGAADIDAATHHGPVPAGAEVSVDYGANTTGYGMHTVWVGGPAGAVTDVTFGNGSAPLPTSADLLAGSVDHLRIRRGSADASASALQDGDGTATTTYQGCSSGPTAPGCATVAGAPGPVTASQPWPFPPAECSQPGAVGGADGQSSGVTAAPPSGQAGEQPGTDGMAGAAVDCTLDRPATARASLGALGLPGSGAALAGAPVLDLAVAQSHVDGSVAPPTDSTPRSVASVTATVRGLHVGLGSLGAFDIGALTQTAVAQAGGRAGTASTSDTVTLQDVTLERDGKVQALCSGPCPDPAATLATLNSVFAGRLELSMPPVEGSYIGGSPGGYVAAVEAQLAEQYGDEQFNGMRAEEAAVHPGLRLVVFGWGDGVPAVSRQVVDLAGVEAEAELGIEVFPAFDAGAQGVDQQAAEAAAGVPAAAALFGAALPLAPPALAPGGGVTGGPASLVERALTGFAWLWQTPGGALQLLLAFGLLGAPIALARRRQTWTQTVVGGDR